MSFWTNIVRLYLICLYQHSHFQTIIRICFSFSYFLMQYSILRIGFGWLDIRSIGGIDLPLRRCVWGLYHCSQQVGGFKWGSLPQFSHGELWSQKNQLLDSNMMNSLINCSFQETDYMKNQSLSLYKQSIIW